MNQIPCPNRGELLTCREEGIDRKMHCPRCRVLLRLDVEPGAQRGCAMPRQRIPLRLALVVAVFLAGLGIGFQWGAHVSRSAPNNGISATSVGFFGASNTVIVDEPATPKPTHPAARDH